MMQTLFGPPSEPAALERFRKGVSKTRNRFASQIGVDILKNSNLSDSLQEKLFYYLGAVLLYLEIQGLLTGWS